MSSIMRRKHVLKEMMADDFELPTEKQQIVRLTACRGNNLHEVEASTPEVDNFLVTMPNKFRKNIFVKRGDFVLVEDIEEGAKVKAEIVKILTPEHVKEFTKSGVWPKRFMKQREPDSEEEEHKDDDADGDEFMVRNKNRPAAALPDNADDETDSDEDSNEESDDDELIASSSSEEEAKPKQKQSS